MNIKKMLFFLLMLQSLHFWAQDLKKRIHGKWEMLQYDLSEENDEDNEISTGEIWVFKENNICEERFDPDDPRKKVVYNYKITKENCQNPTVSDAYYYLTLTNKTIPGDDYCFMISNIDPKNQKDKSERLSLFSHGAISPNVLIRR